MNSEAQTPNPNRKAPISKPLKPADAEYTFFWEGSTTVVLYTVVWQNFVV